MFVFLHSVFKRTTVHTIFVFLHSIFKRTTVHTIFVFLHSVFKRTTQVQEEGTSHELRLHVLAEMVARTLKNTARLYLRKTLMSVKVDLLYTQCTLLSEFLNMVSGSHPDSSTFWTEQVFLGIRARFG
jgi:hypothetical protein